MDIKTWVLLLIVSTGVWASPAAPKEKGKEKETAAAHSGQPEKADVAVTVNGMVCSFCAQGITKKFTDNPQVEKVDVRMEEARVYLTFRGGTTMEDGEIRKMITEAGYEVEKIDRLTDPNSSVLPGASK